MKKLGNGMRLKFLSSWKIVLLALVVVLPGLAGCSGKRPQKEMVFDITADSELNNGQPVCLVIRKVNKKNFLVEDYDQIADMVYSDPPDESLITWKMFLPGKQEKIKVDMPQEGDIGVFGLYTHPAGSWKAMIDVPLEKKYEIYLGKNSLATRKAGSKIWPF